MCVTCLNMCVGVFANLDTNELASEFVYTCLSFCQDELSCRVDFLLDRCFQTEREEMETMENVNKLLLQNVLPLHVACSFMGKTIRNQVKKTQQGRDVQ